MLLPSLRPILLTFDRIIVGVKYCFRYNQRTRQATLAQENGDRVDMANMQRPRRKREKKLMSMEEVNDRFPLTKYKVWRAGREQSGLSTAGGITAPSSRVPNSREHNGLKRASTDLTGAVDIDDGDRSSAEHAKAHLVSVTDGADERPSNSPQVSKIGDDEKSSDGRVERAKSLESDTQAAGVVSPGAEEDDDHVRNAGAPTTIAAVPGDQCAICIEMLEDDDEVRGLSCGHAFHAGCLDPWLTNRRACCPLCKADFYVPKLRIDGSGLNHDTTSNFTTLRPPDSTHRPRLNLGGTAFVLDHHDRYGFPVLVRDRDQQNSPQPTSSENHDAASATEPHHRTNRRTRVFPYLRDLRLPRFGRQFERPQTNGDQSSTTPGQLEAGTR